MAAEPVGGKFGGPLAAESHVPVPPAAVGPDDDDDGSYAVVIGTPHYQIFYFSAACHFIGIAYADLAVASLSSSLRRRAACTYGRYAWYFQLSWYTTTGLCFRWENMLYINWPPSPGGPLTAGHGGQQSQKIFGNIRFNTVLNLMPFTGPDYSMAFTTSTTTSTTTLASFPWVVMLVTTTPTRASGLRHGLLVWVSRSNQFKVLICDLGLGATSTTTTTSSSSTSTSTCSPSSSSSCSTSSWTCTYQNNMNEESNNHNSESNLEVALWPLGTVATKAY